MELLTTGNVVRLCEDLNVDLKLLCFLCINDCKVIEVLCTVHLKFYVCTYVHVKEYPTQ